MSDEQMSIIITSIDRKLRLARLWRDAPASRHQGWASTEPLGLSVPAFHGERGTEGSAEVKP
ncbi:MAG: hypothetical protein ACMUIP_16420 [bacterium]